jgi:2-phospho-L-lactate transferase/gluconeogenesis factor (CofD/UPF0052 family)
VPADRLHVAALGGGHGLAVTLRAARSYADAVSAVVSVADDGGSSGRLRRDRGLLHYLGFQHRHRYVKLPATDDCERCRFT